MQAAPQTPTSRQEKMLQQRQLALKRQRDLAVKRAQPQLLGQGGPLMTQNAMHQKKADGWAKIFVDPSLFDQPARPADQPTSVALSVVPTSPTPEPVQPEKAVAESEAPEHRPGNAAHSEEPRRPATGDSTATDVLDYVPVPTRCRTDVSAVSGGGRPGATAPVPGQEPISSTPGGGWDLSVDEGPLNQGGDKAKGRDRKFWKPWNRNVRVQPGPVDAEDVIETFGADMGDVQEDFLAEKQRPRPFPVDSRIATPWAPSDVTPGGIEEVSLLPGLAEEPQEFDVRQQMRRPPQQQAVFLNDDIDDIDVL